MSTKDESAATTRYLLFAKPEKFSYQQRALEDDTVKLFAQQPLLAIDVGEETVSVVDPASDALISSAAIREVTATPGTYAPMDQSSESTRRLYTQPLLLLEGPGSLDVRIGILPMRVTTWTGHQFRYAWRRKARPLDLDHAYRHDRVERRPMHVVTDAEWRSLVGTFGLATLVVDEYASGALDSEAKFMKVVGIAFAALIIAATTVFFGWFIWAIATGNIHHHQH
ncbi:hypothetical protein A5787_14130 [Mycobacterium sp. 852002-50816_SCH5313054-b]|uniref:hypothetical protein n=1 Tax=Mycobacterium sp. 852002-50816_SCH5313054-b TaxID=1834092 RepID=UPI0008019869|nr:hypothetical protein [Mycobacterium sp. 852002-50816_SCH5313054-b]OBF44066.1 hypothetical protein A5787_14130 [Mycobacterium sp. 852002-50816_SCH5313054-b]